MISTIKTLSNSPFFKQALLSICISVSYFTIGLVRGYSSSAIPSINELNPYILPSKEISSWIGSVPPLGAFFGSLVAGPLMHYTGRKFTVLISSPIWATSWAFIAIANSWESMFVGRVLSGFCAGVCLPAAQIYVTECSDPKIRGVIGSFPAIFMSCGILVSYIIGAYLPWDLLAWASCGAAVAITFTVFFLPESPVWLRSKHRYEDAQLSVEWLKLKDNVNATDENVRNNVQQLEQRQNGIEDTMKPKLHSLKTLFTRPVLLPLSIGLTLLTIQQISGIDAIVFFTVEIFRASGSTIEGHLATIIVGTVQLGSNILSLFVIDRCGRRPLLIVSGVIMFIATASMGLAFHLNEIGNTNYGFLPLVSLIVFMVGFSIGFGCIPFLIMGEIFPMEQRSLLSSIAGSFNLGVMFIVIKTYHTLEALITTAGTFWIYSVLCGAGVIYVIFFVPETKGRDLESIQKLFVKRRKSAGIIKTISTRYSITDNNEVIVENVIKNDVQIENTKC